MDKSYHNKDSFFSSWNETRSSNSNRFGPYLLDTSKVYVLHEISLKFGNNRLES
jgi:hypothetical protein